MKAHWKTLPSSNTGPGTEVGDGGGGRTIRAALVAAGFELEFVQSDTLYLMREERSVWAARAAE